MLYIKPKYLPLGVNFRAQIRRAHPGQAPQRHGGRFRRAHDDYRQPRGGWLALSPSEPNAPASATAALSVAHRRQARSERRALRPSTTGGAGGRRRASEEKTARQLRPRQPQGTDRGAGRERRRFKPVALIAEQRGAPESSAGARREPRREATAVRRERSNAGPAARAGEASERANRATDATKGARAFLAVRVPAKKGGGSPAAAQRPEDERARIAAESGEGKRSGGAPSGRQKRPQRRFQQSHRPIPLSPL